MANGILGDLSGVLERVDESEYLAGVFEAGQMEGSQYLIPLMVNHYGFVVNTDGGALGTCGSRQALLDQLTENYPQEIANLTGLCNLLVTGLSYPVVNRSEGKIFLYDENYTAAIQQAKVAYEIMSHNPTDGDYASSVTGGTTFCQSSSNPILSFDSAANVLTRQDIQANLAYVPLPDETGGVTVDVGVYAFTPATSENQEAAVIFLSWLLSEDVQNGTVPVFSSYVYYPVRKGCAEKQMELYEDYVLESVGQSALDSINALDERVTNAKYSTHYDYELLNILTQWQRGSVDLDTALQELYDGWALYLDE